MSDSNFFDTIKDYANTAADKIVSAKDAFFQTIAENQAAHDAAPQDEAELAIELVEHYFGHEYQ